MVMLRSWICFCYMAVLVTGSKNLSESDYEDSSLGDTGKKYLEIDEGESAMATFIGAKGTIEYSLWPYSSTSSEVVVQTNFNHNENQISERPQQIPILPKLQSHQSSLGFRWELWFAIAMTAFRWTRYARNFKTLKVNMKGENSPDMLSSRIKDTSHLYQMGSLFPAWMLVLAAFIFISDSAVTTAEALKLMPTTMNSTEGVSIALRDLVAREPGDCSVFLVSSGEKPFFFDSMMEFHKDTERTMTIITLTSEMNDPLPLQSRTKALKLVLEKYSCWMLVLDLTSMGDQILRFMESSNMFHHPDIPVIMVGPSSSLESSLIGSGSFRNSKRALYLTFDDYFGKVNGTDMTSVYARCLYCNVGNPGIRLLGRWKVSERNDQNFTHEDESNNFNGHQFDICTKPRLPLANVDLNWDGPEGTVGPLDSVDVRMVKIYAKKLNFTYLIRLPWDNNWGLPGKDGNFTGVVGTLQHEKADFSFLLTPLPVRLTVVDATRSYCFVNFVILSPMPEPLPRSLALIRPFGGWVWAGIISSCILSGIFLWFLQEKWSEATKSQGMSLSSSLMLVWRVLLEDPAPTLPQNLSSQMLIGCWWLGCLIILFAYRSALIAHLTVVKNQAGINTLEDILAREASGWRWGRVDYSGASLVFLSQHPSPVMQKIFVKFEIHPQEVQLKKVLEGGYSLISRKFWALSDILMAQSQGLPIHMGKTEYPVPIGYAWGFRKGSPMRKIIDLVKRRLVEAGLVDLWLQQIVEQMARDAAEKPLEVSAEVAERMQKEQSLQKTRILTLEHVQGSFYLMFIGYGFAFSALLLEYIYYIATSKTV